MRFYFKNKTKPQSERGRRMQRRTGASEGPQACQAPGLVFSCTLFLSHAPQNNLIKYAWSSSLFKGSTWGSAAERLRAAQEGGESIRLRFSPEAELFEQTGRHSPVIDHFNCTIFKFANSFSCLLKSAFNTSNKIFISIIVIFSTRICLVPFYNFHFFIHVQLMVWQRFPWMLAAKTKRRRVEKNHLSQSLQIDCVLGHSFNSYLVFLWAWGKSLRSFQFFSEHACCPGRAHGFLNSPIYIASFRCSNFSKNLSQASLLGFR